MRQWIRITLTSIGTTLSIGIGLLLIALYSPSSDVSFSTVSLSTMDEHHPCDQSTTELLGSSMLQSEALLAIKNDQNCTNILETSNPTHLCGEEVIGLVLAAMVASYCSFYSSILGGTSFSRADYEDICDSYSHQLRSFSLYGFLRLSFIIVPLCGVLVWLYVAAQSSSDITVLDTYWKQFSACASPLLASFIRHLSQYVTKLVNYIESTWHLWWSSPKPIS